ncbi:MAG: DNA gyrase inhibitor YacG [Myxococcota bacterium]
MRLTCPRCKGPSALDTSNEWRPFCSERCRLLDLGGWLDGDYAIAGEPTSPTSFDGRLDAPGGLRRRQDSDDLPS